MWSGNTLTSHVVRQYTVTVVCLRLLKDLHVDGMRVPDLGDLGEGLEDEDERDENRETLLREPSDVPNLKNKCAQKC